MKMNIHYKMQKLLFFAFFCVCLANQSFSQTSPFSAKKQWILPDNKIERDTVIFTPFDTSKVQLNTLILKFMPKGKIEYDYKSGEDIDACAGVDFLDIDTDASSWYYNSQTKQLTLQIKGGYASLDDFKFKRIYNFAIVEGDLYLYKTKEIFYQDLTKINTNTHK